jgi:hypothetical protein
MMRITTSAFILVILLGLSGCGSRMFSSRETNPVLEDYVGTWPNREVGTLATDAAHRVTVIRMAEGRTSSEEQWQRGEFCAEPPPDAMVNVAGIVANAIATKIKIPEPTSATAIAEGSGETEFYRTIATIMNPLLRRSQGLQWNRDNLSFACNAYLNRIITKKQYLDLVYNIIILSEKLIDKEMEKLPKFDVTINGLPPGSPTPPTLPERKKPEENKSE